MFLQRLWKTNNSNRGGFTLIELAIVLAVTSLLTAGLWRMMSSGNTQLRDQAAADQHRELINAVRAYLASEEGQTLLKPTPAPADGSTFDIKLDCAAPTPGFCNYRPANFSFTNSYGQGYEARVRRSVDGSGVLTSYSFMIMTTGGETIPDTSGGRISSTIGNDGGFIYNAVVCGGANTFACGAFGTWNASPVAAFGFGSAPTGHVASRTYVGMNAELNLPWLARIKMDQHDSNADGIDDLNTFLDSNVETAMNGSTFFGGTPNEWNAAPQTFAGKIYGLTEMVIGRDETNKTGPVPLTVIGNCMKLNYGDTDCYEALSVEGDTSISGYLVANRLFALQFIYNTSSDLNLKDGVAPINDALDRISKMKGYSFVMKGSKDKKYGVIAQEVEKVFPELVSESANGMKAVDYMGLIGPLVASVNELKKENSDLKSMIEAQSLEIKKLQKDVGAGAK